MKNYAIVAPSDSNARPNVRPVAGVTGQESSRARSHRRLSSRRYYKLPVVIIMLILVKHITDVIYNINAM